MEGLGLTAEMVHTAARGAEVGKIFCVASRRACFLFILALLALPLSAAPAASHNGALCSGLRTFLRDSVPVPADLPTVATDTASTAAVNVRAESAKGTDASATETRRETFHRRMNVFKRFVRNFDSYDTTYISPNYYDYTAMLQSTNFFQSYTLSGESDGKTQSISTKPAPNVKIGPYFGWRWIFLGYTFDVAHPQSLGRSSELSLSLYSSMLGLDAIYVRNDGDYRLRATTGFDGVGKRQFKGTPFDGIKSSLLSVSAYYVANYRHFSYPAVYNQSTVQRKSSGSALFGAGYSRQSVSFDYTRLPEALRGADGGKELIVEGLKFSGVSYDYYYLSAGYGYNWVPARNVAIGFSVLPSFGLRKASGVRLKGNELWKDITNLSFDCTSRLGVVWNNTRLFAGASVVDHLYMYRRKGVSLANNVCYVNVYAGIYFHRRKQYR